MRKARNRNKRNRLGSLLSNKRLHVLVVALLFGAVGAYLVFGAKAAVVNISYNAAELSSGINSGEVFPMTTTASYNSTDKQWVTVEFSADGIEQGAIQCDQNPGLSCTISGRNKEFPWEFSKVYIFCAELPPGNKTVSFTLFFTALTNLPANSQWYSHVTHGKIEGRCGDTDTPPPPEDPQPPMPDPFDDDGNGEGPDDGNEGNNNGNEGTNNGRDGEGTGPGGGGGGSSATTQGNANNATPSNTDQGDATEQPIVRPSPFFDGKLFALGSSAEAGTSNTVGVGGLRVGYGWFYLLGLLVTIALGFLGWKYRMRLKRYLVSLRH